MFDKREHADFQMAFVNNLTMLLEKGKTVSPRDMETKELLMHSFKITHPERRVFISASRAGNPYAQIAETVWMLAGRDDMDFLEEFIPQCRKWSDDGETWRAAYGPRLRQWEGLTRERHPDDPTPQLPMSIAVDQVWEAYKKLSKSPDTRQAVINLWDPAKDWVEDSLDYPCNNWLHFIIRDGKLHLNVSIRSNDAVYGFSHADFFGWSILQQTMASWVGVEVGHMTWNATSFHMYARHYDKAEDILSEIVQNMMFYAKLYEVVRPVKMTSSYHNSNHMFHTLLELEDVYRKRREAFGPEFPREYGDEFHTHCAVMFWVWHASKNGIRSQDVAEALNYLNNMGTDLAMAATYYTARKHPEVVKHLHHNAIVEHLKEYDYLP